MRLRMRNANGSILIGLLSGAGCRWVWDRSDGGSAETGGFAPAPILGSGVPQPPRFSVFQCGATGPPVTGRGVLGESVAGRRWRRRCVGEFGAQPIPGWGSVRCRGGCWRLLVWVMVVCAGDAYGRVRDHGPGSMSRRASPVFPGHRGGPGRSALGLSAGARAPGPWSSVSVRRVVSVSTVVRGWCGARVGVVVVRPRAYGVQWCRPRCGGRLECGDERVGPVGILWARPPLPVGVGVVVGRLRLVFALGRSDWLMSMARQVARAWTGRLGSRGEVFACARNVARVPACPRTRMRGMSVDEVCVRTGRQGLTGSTSGAHRSAGGRGVRRSGARRPHVVRGVGRRWADSGVRLRCYGMPSVHAVPGSSVWCVSVSEWSWTWRRLVAWIAQSVILFQVFLWRWPSVFGRTWASLRRRSLRACGRRPT
jgi:hypothetical protein